MPDSLSHHCPEAWELETWGMRMVEQRKPRQDLPHLKGEVPRVVRNPHWQGHHATVKNGASRRAM